MPKPRSRSVRQPAGRLASTFMWLALVAMLVVIVIIVGPWNPRVRHYTYEIVNTYPHDPLAFTQGLVIDAGTLYEGTGLWGRSSLRQVDLVTGAVLRQHDLAPELFGEGIAVVQDRIYQLTWQSNQGFIYARDSFEQLGTFTYPTEGWGLTYDGAALIMSDGSANLYYLDPNTLQETRRLQVMDGDTPVTQLNELEYVDGKVYANVWRTNRIAIISPRSGAVTGWIDLKGLVNTVGPTQPVDVLNGIAYDAQADRLYVTGKLWPALFEITLIPVEQ